MSQEFHRCVSVCNHRAFLSRQEPVPAPGLRVAPRSRMDALAAGARDLQIGGNKRGSPETMIYRSMQLQPRTWQARVGIILAAALGVGLVVAFLVLAVGVAILLLPVVAVLAAIGWWRWRKIEAAMREEAARREPGGDDARTIEIDYRVIDEPNRRG